MRPSARDRCSIFALLLGTFVCLAPVAAGLPASGPGPLSPLTSARAAHDLTLEDAARHHPVHFKAVVTYYDPWIDPRRATLFLHDATGAVFVALVHALVPGLHPGSLVEIDGFSADGDFAPIVERATVRILGEGQIPAQAPRVSVSQMLTGKYDGQWVEVEGVVRSIREFGRNVELQIAASDGHFSARTLKEPGADYDRLVDAKILLHANAGPAFNRRKQLTGVHMMFPNLRQVKVEESPPGDPFALPPVRIDHLMRYSPDIAVRHRVHVRGAVTLQWPGQTLCIQENVPGGGALGLCVQSVQDEPLALGQVVDMVGFPDVGAFNPVLTDTVVRPTAERQTPAIPFITVEQALRGEHDAELVQIEGRLIGRDHGDERGVGLKMMLSSGKFLFPIVLPEGSAEDWPVARWQDGSLLRITGVCSNQEWTEDFGKGFSDPTSFRILLRSPADVVVLQKPSWWTARHLAPVLATVLVAALCALGWAILLRQRIAEQSAVIRQQNVTLTGLSFQDGLTLLANRRKFDETLCTELERSVRTSTSLSLLMIDVDHFKSLNDTCGHQRGDECLMQVAVALRDGSLRGSDLIARYGGEEFAVILPLCDETGALATAERMRMAVLDRAIQHPHSPFSGRLSISVGVATVVPDAGTTPACLIALADHALYESKQQGRNRSTSSAASVHDYALSISAS